MRSLHFQPSSALLLILLWLVCGCSLPWSSVVLVLPSALAFSATPPPSNNNLGIALERFVAKCPAGEDCIQKFDASLLDADPDTNDSSSSIWVAVYRSNQNQPSVFIRDEFFHAMKSATTTTTTSTPTNTNMEDDMNKMNKMIQNTATTKASPQKPVAVAQLRPSEDFGKDGGGVWILDSWRCALKKENVDPNCDGGSEYLEALSVAVDSLLLQYLKSISVLGGGQEEEQPKPQTTFDGTIRTKATLFSKDLLTTRGFQEVDTLSRDMATHVSNLQDCLDKFAARSVDTTLNPGARERALQIVSLLSPLLAEQDAQKDDDESTKASDSTLTASDEDGDDDINDPWAGIKMQI